MQERYFKTKLGNITSSFVRTRASWREISGDVLWSWGNSTGRGKCCGFDNDAVETEIRRVASKVHGPAVDRLMLLVRV
jgi:hypothetical protein